MGTCLYRFAKVAKICYTTLKENGLEVVEDVAPISARVIVNLASAKMKKAAIQKVIAELEKGLNN